MNDFFFWNTWSVTERRAGLAVLCLMAVTLIGLMLFSGVMFGGGQPAWDVMAQLSEIAIPANRLDLGSMVFDIAAPSVFVTEQYVAPLMLPDTTSAVVFLVVSMVGLSLVLAGLTTLSRFWYLGGTALFILLFVSSRTEIIAFPGLPDRLLLLLSLLLYVGLGYYFHAFRIHASVPARAAVFGAVSAGLLALVAFGSNTVQPVYAFLAYSLPLWLLPAILFFVVSATEIVYGLVWLSTSRTTGMGRRALLNLLAMLSIYLLVLVFAYVSNTKKADWGLVIVPPYLLGTLAAVIGVFGFKSRCDAAEGHLPFRTAGFWLYSGLLLITVGITGMALASANDPLLEVLEDSIVNAQLGMGAAFTFYILANFLPLLKKGLQVHKVLYKPLNFSLTKTRVMGVAIVVTLFSMQNLFPVKQGIAGYFNNLGDWHTLSGEYVLAEQYYNMSLQQEFQNHKGNYALASLARMQGDQNAAVFYFRQATLKKPSPQAYVGLANLLAEDNLYFEAMFSLKEAGRVFPDNGPVLNNLGLLYARTNLSDSAWYFLNAASRVSDDDIPAANILATLAGVLDPAAVDSLAPGKSGSMTLEANRLMARNLARRHGRMVWRNEATRADSLLSATGYAYWLNYTYNQAEFDPLLPDKVRHIAARNAIMGDELLLAAAHADFYGGSKTRAIETLLALSGGESKKAGQYRNLLGHWFLQLGLFDKALDVFSEADDTEGIVGYAVSQALAGNPVGGLIVLEKLAKGYQKDSMELSAIQEALTSVVFPTGQVDSVLATARKAGTEAAIRQALQLNPYNPEIVEAAVGFYAEKKADVATAYQLVVDALRFNENSYRLWANYALLNLEMGLTEEADNANARVRALATDAGYHDFSTRYQAKWSLKQKEREEF